MFYCDGCAADKDWPITTLYKSRGRCEVCNEMATCNDMPSKHLPAPKDEPSQSEVDAAIDSIREARS